MAATNPGPLLAGSPPDMKPDSGPRPEIVGPSGPLKLSAKAAEPSSPGASAQSPIASGREALQRNDLVAARTHFNEALKSGAAESDISFLRGELIRLANETIFSPRIFDDDPFVERYIIQPGDALGNVAKANKVSAELLANINKIADKNRIRAGQVIKVIKGPFHAVVDTSEYSLDVYLGDTLVKHYKVGLGVDNSTPTGEWRVGNKLVNPTYYPPRGGQIVAADDPNNPLGERWIGLIGVSGEAAGQERYGLHGTIDPMSIGQNISLGCIRLHNEDAEALYTFLIENESTVTVRN
jgi:lipoprotein-anchoring transpeptidase ErfK/SrfK